MIAQFNRFELQMTLAQAESASHPGSCDADVAYLLRDTKTMRQLRKINPDLIRAELAEYGAWNTEKLQNEKENHARIVWLAAGDICENHAQKVRD